MVTDSLFLNICIGVAGLALLAWGSNWLIDGAAAIAQRCRIPDTIIGLTLVSIGTSLPELATNIYAAAIQQGDIAIGNVIGSNITNVFLVLGAAVLFLGQIDTDRILFGRDTMIMLGFYVLFALLALSGLGDLEITRAESALLLAASVAYIIVLVRRHDTPTPGGADTAKPQSLGKALGMLAVGVITVPLGAKMMVDNVCWGAEQFAIPGDIISATIIALGTSVPELAVTLAGIVKGKTDIAMGNVVGSNIFNIALVMGVTGAICPVPVGPATVAVMLPLMTLSGLMLAVFMWSSWRLVRWEGLVFVLAYGGFIGMNVFLVLKK